ncbi:MAG: phage tail tape measure protein [Algiphilus sp.]|uniref:phage tail tape measure protein n=1 Tax=Algiphilus sp. TaxID=1872431 RepID=UPI0032EE9A2B
MSDLDVALRFRAEGARAAQGEVNRLAGAVDKTGTAGRAANAQQQQLNQSVGQFRTQALGAVGALVGTAGLVAGLRASVQEANAFETAMTEVSTLLSDGSGIEELTQSARELAVEFGGLPTDQAKAAYNIVSSGASDSAEATQLLTEANKLATAGITDVNTAADGLTSVLNAYNLEASEAGTVSDQFFATVRAGKTTVDELTAAVGRVVPLASQAGIGFNEVGAGLATLTAQGVNTNEAVTQLRGLIQSVIKPTQEAKDAAKELGIQFDAEALRAKGLAGFLADVEEATKGNSDATTQLFTSVEGLSAVLGLTGESAEKFTTNVDNVTNSFGEAEKAAGKVAETAEFAQKRFSASFSLVQQTIGELVNKGLVPLQKAATAVFNIFLDLPGPVQATAVGVTGLTAAVLALAAAKRTLLPLFFAVTAGATANATAMTTSAGATTASTVATRAFSVALRSVPILAAVAALGSLIGAYSEYSQAARSAEEAQEAANQKLRDGIAAARENAAAAAEGADGARAAIDAIAGGVDNLSESQRAFYRSNLQQAEQYLEAQIAIGVREQELHGNTRIALGEVGEQLRAVRAAQEQLGAAIQRQADGPYSALQDRVDALRSEFNGLGDDIGDVAAGTLQALGDRARASLGEAQQAVADVRAEFPALQNVSDEALARIDQGFADAIGRVEELNGIINTVSQEALRRLGIDASEVMTGVRSEVRETIGAFDTLASDATTDARLIEAAYGRVLEQLDSPAELRAFESSLQQAARAGFDVGDALEVVRNRLRSAGGEATVQGDEVARVTDEYGRLGDAAEDAGSRAENAHRRAADAARDQARATEQARNANSGSIYGGATTIAGRGGGGGEHTSPIDQDLQSIESSILNATQSSGLSAEDRQALVTQANARLDELQDLARSGQYRYQGGVERYARAQTDIIEDVRRQADEILGIGGNRSQRDLARIFRPPSLQEREDAATPRRRVEVDLRIGGESFPVQTDDDTADALLRRLENARAVSAAGA